MRLREREREREPMTRNSLSPSQSFVLLLATIPNLGTPKQYRLQDGEECRRQCCCVLPTISHCHESRGCSTGAATVRLCRGALVVWRRFYLYMANFLDYVF